MSRSGPSRLSRYYLGGRIDLPFLSMACRDSIPAGMVYVYICENGSKLLGFPERTRDYTGWWVLTVLFNRCPPLAMPQFRASATGRKSHENLRPMNSFPYRRRNLIDWLAILVDYAVKCRPGGGGPFAAQ